MVVVFAIREVAVRLLNTVRVMGHQDTFLWLGSDGWTYDTPKVSSEHGTARHGQGEDGGWKGR